MGRAHEYAAVTALWLVGAVAGEPLFPSMWFPLDPQVGDVEPVTADALTERMRGKSALVVGGTDGIGRGTAIAMAQAGASVVVVGHSASKAQAVVGNMSAVARFPQEQKFKSYLVDLFTVKGGLSLAEQLRGNKTRFDYVVLTVGMWPDWKDPRTDDGLDKVISLDLVSRFLVTREVLPLLNSGARVMSILASTWRFIFWRDVTGIAPATMKDIAAGKLEGHYSLPQMLGTVGTMGDAWLQLMSKHHPEVNYIGTFPGVVATELLDHGFVPKWLIPLANLALKNAGLDPVECGKLHATIISSPNAARRPVTYFGVRQMGHSSAKLEGRLTNSLAYDAEFGQWVWSFLEETIANHTILAEGEHAMPAKATARDSTLVV
mmetsp:Transcript_116617/g.341331  ORF Transcript_116617/g.341331 Transcript_116617/m.341331 type:complete len:377 (-) Transcript_116617:52-1182(-)